MVLDWSGTILPRYYLVRKVPNQANLPAVAGRFPKAQDKTELSQLFPTEKMRSDEDADEVDGFDVFAGSDGPSECFGQFSPPAMPFLLRSILVTIVAIIIILNIVNIIIIIVIIRWFSWKTNGSGTLPNLEAREISGSGVGAQTGAGHHLM